MGQKNEGKRKLGSGVQSGPDYSIPNSTAEFKLHPAGQENYRSL